MSKRCERVEQLYHQALEKAEGERLAFLKTACADDEDLRRELESLLGFQVGAGRPMETSAPQLLEQPSEGSGTTLGGRRIGAYQILSLLGKGGMGEVYRARNVDLARIVALKLLPMEFSCDSLRLGRFLQEARAAAALNHPNVAQIYEIGEAGGLRFIAMEFAEGTTLAERIGGRPMKIAEILAIGIQIADALDEAHRRGVIHRDIKPSNLVVNAKGQVKILDFGLAKMAPTDSQDPVGETRLSTSPGVVMGTVDYMSPEQVLGREVDPRADLYSLGVVLYEMAAGQVPFPGASITEKMDRILHHQPEALGRFNYEALGELERIVRKCLQKDPAWRYQSARDLLIDLKTLANSTSVEGVGTHAIAVEKPLRRRWVIPAILILGGLAALAVSLAVWRGLPRPPPHLPSYRALTNDGSSKPGSTPVVNGGSLLYFARYAGPYCSIAQVSASGGEVAPVSFPLWDGKCDVVPFDISPDHSELLVAVGSDTPNLGIGDAPLWVLPTVGGGALRLGNLRASYAKWSPDGARIAYTFGADLYQARSDGSDARRLWTAPSGMLPRSLTWSPGGDHLAVAAYPRGNGFGALYRIELDGSGARVLAPEWENKYSCGEVGQMVERGLLYFLSSRTKVSRSDIWRLREEQGFWSRSPGELFQLTAGPLSFGIPTPSTDGRTLFAAGTLQRGEMVRYDRRASQFLPHLSGISAEMAEYSKDGQWVAYVTYPERTLWRMKTDGSQLVQLTTPGLQVHTPRWSPDGRYIAFSAGAGATAYKIYRVPAEGGSPEQLVPGPCSEADASWAPDGDRLAFAPWPWSVKGPPCTTGVRLLDLKTKQVTLVPGSENLFSPRWSPDGSHLLVLATKDYSVMMFDISAQKWVTVLNGHAGFPNWSADGNSFYCLYRDPAPWVVRFQIEQHKLERLVDLSGASLVGDGWVGQTPAGDVLVTRDLGNTEIYALELETQ